MSTDNIYCCQQFEVEFQKSILQYRNNSEYGNIGYYFECDCDAGEFYEESDILKFCPWCGRDISL